MERNLIKRMRTHMSKSTQQLYIINVVEPKNLIVSQCIHKKYVFINIKNRYTVTSCLRNYGTCRNFVCKIIIITKGEEKNEFGIVPLQLNTDNIYNYKITIMAKKENKNIYQYIVKFTQKNQSNFLGFLKKNNNNYHYIHTCANYYASILCVCL